MLTLLVVSGQDLVASGPQKVALFVGNRASAEFDGKIPVVEDFIASKLAKSGVGIITRDLLIGNLSSFDSETASAVRDTDSLNSQLSNSSSAKRLAENIDADYIMVASINSFGERKKEVKAYGADYTNYIYTLRLSYRLTDSNGVALLGDTVTSVQTEQNTIYSNEGSFSSSKYSQAGSSSADNVAAFSTNKEFQSGNSDDNLAMVVKKYEQAVGLVVTTNSGRPVGMATAWAIAPNVFATNAHVSQPVAELLKNGGTAYVILNKSPEKRFRITQAITHPNYMRVGANFEGRKPAAPTNDVGILKVSGSTDVWFPVAGRDELTELDSGYRIAYLGFPMEGLSGNGVDPRNPVATMQSGIITSNTDWWQGNGEFEERLLVQHNLGATGGASGSPIFNPEGEVVALLNAGNIVITVQYDENGEPFVARTPSAALINFGQRVDLLKDIYDTGSISKSTGFSNSGVPALSKGQTQAKAVFRDPNVSAFVDDLLDDATSQIAQSMTQQLANREIAEPEDANQLVTISFIVETADMYVPDVRLGPENTVSVLDGKLKVSPLDVAVEIDGLTVGKAPGKLSLKPGISQLSLTRTGYVPWSRTINAVDGQTIYASMQMTDEGLKRWQKLTVFMNALKDGTKLTDAQIELIRAQAKMLEQSGYKIDIKVDTEDAPTFETHKSIF